MPDVLPVPAIPSAAYPALFEAHLDQVQFALPDTMRAFLANQITDSKAKDDGVTVTSPSVLDACLEAVAKIKAFILADKITGYGPRRLRYLLELALQLAGKVATLDTSLVNAAGAGAASTVNLRTSRTDRRLALRVLKNLAGHDAEAKARIRKLGGRRERPDERSLSLQAIATELDAVLARVPAELAADAGVTPDLTSRLRVYAGAVLSARETAKGARIDVSSLYDEMNVLDGRILHELRVLAGTVRDARKGDKTIPSLNLGILKRGTKKAKAKGAAPAKGAEAAKKVEPAKGAEAAKGAEVAKGAEAAKKAEPAKSVEPAKGAEPAKDEGAKKDG